MMGLIEGSFPTRSLRRRRSVAPATLSIAQLYTTLDAYNGILLGEQLLPYNRLGSPPLTRLISDTERNNPSL